MPPRDLAPIFSAMMMSGDPVHRSMAENILFEERLVGGRWDAYQERCDPADDSYDAWREAHKDYLWDAVWVDLPETFSAINANASLPPSVVSLLGANQSLIRVESLDYALNNTRVKSLADLEHLFSIYKGWRKDPLVDQGDAKAAIEEICDSLNRNPYAVRPRFAAFAEELQDDLRATNWAELLRDRLGLAHLPPTGAFGPHPVILMQYSVRAVVEQSVRQKAAHALAAPTHLDGDPYEYFHPAPSQETYGRTLNLAGEYDAQRLASEVLHLRIHYSPSHIVKVGAITIRPLPSVQSRWRMPMPPRNVPCLCRFRLEDRGDDISIYRPAGRRPMTPR